MTTDLITKLQSVDLDAMAKRIYENAKRHGFHNEYMEIEHWLCLVIWSCPRLWKLTGTTKGLYQRLLIGL